MSVLSCISFGNPVTNYKPNAKPTFKLATPDFIDLFRSKHPMQSPTKYYNSHHCIRIKRSSLSSCSWLKYTFELYNFLATYQIGTILWFLAEDINVSNSRRPSISSQKLQFQNGIFLWEMAAAGYFLCQQFFHSKVFNVKHIIGTGVTL